MCLYLICHDFPSSLAQDSPQDFVGVHNVARAQVGVGPIEWDKTVVSFAQQYANQRFNDCRLVHSGGPYGENIAWGSPDLSAKDAVQLWVDEKPFYNYETNTCAAGELCGHYTQVVWRKSVRIGCAKVRCTDNIGGTFIICNYEPPGNFLYQRPY